MIHHIVVGSDGSEPAIHAAQMAADLARKYDARVTVVTVLEATDSLHASFSAIHSNQYIEAAQAFQAEAETRTQKVFEEQEIACETRREVGHPVERIVAIATQEKADLVVIGGRGRSAFQSLLVGSVTFGVLQHAPCPVLVVK